MPYLKFKRQPLILIFLAGFSAFAIYIWILYGQLQSAFQQQVEFIPTRIYSDVTRIVPALPRAFVEERLKGLAYTPRREENSLKFTLHTPEYPPYLVPEGHPVLDAKDQLVTLQFDGPDPDSLLQAIVLDGKEISDIYLEPELVATLSRGGSREIRALVRFDEIPTLVKSAIIAIEDHHFLDHNGLDPRSIARAIWVNMRKLSFAQGGSTITQQLVKNLMVRRTKNIFRKINELFLALILEMKFGKEQILERYLNEVYLGQVGNLEIHGVAEGAKHFFGKNLNELNLGEIALLAGQIRSPVLYSPYRHRERALERQRVVLRRMVETGHIPEEEALAAHKLPIRLAPPQTASNKAPFFTDFVKAELIRHLKDKLTEQEITEAGFRVYTTLDMILNSAAQRAVSEGVSRLEKQLKLASNERLEGALASVDHSNGYIRALIGGRNYAQSNFNRILNMRRQVGSTFKPFVYLGAILKGEDANGIAYGPGHPAEDATWTLVFDRGKQKWTPRNYEKEFMGWTSYRKALAHSVNTIAAKVGYEVGIDPIIKIARALGIESDLPAVPSLALGVAELSPVDLLRAYAVLANHGIQDELTVIRGITEENGRYYARFVYHPKQVIEPAVSELMTDMLQSVFTEGTARVALKFGFDRPAAGKTGTTSNHRDAWFAGYTPQLTTVVWVGMDQENKSKVNLSGASSALPIWVQFMKDALAGEPPTPFPLSPNLVDVRIDQHSGKIATSDCPSNQVVVEKYIRGHEPRTDGCEPVWPASAPSTTASF